MTQQTPETRRLAVGAVLAVHDSDPEAIDMLLKGIRRPVLLGVVEALAELADSGVRGRAGSADAAREALAAFALGLAAE